MVSGQRQTLEAEAGDGFNWLSVAT